MNVPSNDSMVWPVIRMFFLMIMLGMCLAFNYNVPFDPIKDPRAMIILAILSLGFDYTKLAIAPNSKDPS